MTRPAFLDNLKSQREEIKSAIAAGKCIVYGYLRAKDSGTAKAGTLYYVGITQADPYRPYQKHTRGVNTPQVPVPSENLVRLLKVVETPRQMYEVEIQLISLFGRKDLKTGILLNRSAGGDTCNAGGINLPAQQAAADKYDISLKVYQELSFQEFRAMQSWCRRNSCRTGKDYLQAKQNGASVSTLGGGKIKQAFLQRAEMTHDQLLAIPSNKLGSLHHFIQRGGTYLNWLDKQNNLPWQKYDLPESTWLNLSDREKKNIMRRFQSGLKGRFLLFDSRLIKTSQKLGVDISMWAALSKLGKQTVQRRFAQGKRGSELLQGIAA